MMPIDFEGSNLTLHKPKDMTDEQCMSIEAYRGMDKEGVPFICMCWQPSKEDIEAIAAGRPIWVSTLGHSFAPMSIYTMDENDQANV